MVLSIPVFLTVKRKPQGEGKGGVLSWVTMICPETLGKGPFQSHDLPSPNGFGQPGILDCQMETPLGRVNVRRVSGLGRHDLPK